MDKDASKTTLHLKSASFKYCGASNASAECYNVDDVLLCFLFIWFMCDELT